MPISRPIIKQNNSVAAVLKTGWGMLESYSETITGTGATTLTAAILQGGLIVAGATAAANYTLDTGANMDIAFPDADVGDEWNVNLSNPTANIVTIVTAAGITLLGNAAIAADTCKQIRFLRTGTGTWNARV